MSDQYAVCRPPDCRLRPDVGSSKARWRQPTCGDGAGYNLAHAAATQGNHAARRAGIEARLALSRQKMQKMPLFTLAKTERLLYNYLVTLYTGGVAPPMLRGLTT